MLDTSLCVSEYFPLGARTVIFKRPTFFWNTYKVISFAWRTIYLQQCIFMPQFPLLSNPVSFGTKISVQNPSSQPSSCQYPVAEGCKPGPVPISQLFLAGYITLPCKLSPHSKDHTSYFSLIVAHFMDHERVLLIHLGNNSLPFQCPPLLLKMHWLVLTDHTSLCQRLWFSAFCSCWSPLCPHGRSKRTGINTLTQWLMGMPG